MQTSNTKLTSAQKDVLKGMKADARANGMRLVNLDNKTVIAYKRFPNTVEFALSVKSPNEQKFRVKVGEYLALCRFEAGETVKMGVADFEAMMEYVFDVYLV